MPIYLLHTRMGTVIKETSDVREVFALLASNAECMVTTKQPGLQIVSQRRTL